MVGTHYRVGKKIGEGSFGVVFEGAFPLLRSIGTCENFFYVYLPVRPPFFLHSGVNVLTNTPVAIKFVRFQCSLGPRRDPVLPEE